MTYVTLTLTAEAANKRGILLLSRLASPGCTYSAQMNLNAGALHKNAYHALHFTDNDQIQLTFDSDRNKKHEISPELMQPRGNLEDRQSLACIACQESKQIVEQIESTKTSETNVISKSDVCRGSSGFRDYGALRGQSLIPMKKAIIY